ncbi:hypothetical protein BHE74_00026358 [Ensete ventricosum]|nr:hypothetical protein BHE74_00026358 [Ensete ventricosum]
MHSRIGATMTVNFWSHGITLSHAFHERHVKREPGPLFVGRESSSACAGLLFVKAERSLVALSLLRGSNPPTSDDDLAALAGGNGDLLGFLLDMFLFSKEGKKLLA